MPSPSLAFLHTAEVHVATFSQLVSDLRADVTVQHVVKPALLARARHEGINAELQQHVTDAMKQAASTGAKVVICTCSTLGALAEKVEGDFVAMRIDRAMADEAVTQGQAIVVVAALESTLAPTIALLNDSARRLHKAPTISPLLIADAWQYFEKGDEERYLQRIAKAIMCHADAYDVVGLAQASMAAVTALCPLDTPILSSPRLGVMAAIQRLEEMRNADV